MKELVTKAADAVSEYAPTRGIALILSLGLFLYGAWLFLPIDSFSNPAYSTMGNIAAKQVWGGLYMFAGSTLGWGVWFKSEKWIATGSFLGFFLWSLVLILGLIAAPVAPLHIIRLTVVLMHAWLYIQTHVHPELVTGTVKISDLKDFVKRKEYR